MEKYEEELDFLIEHSESTLGHLENHINRLLEKETILKKLERLIRSNISSCIERWKK